MGRRGGSRRGKVVDEGERKAAHENIRHIPITSLRPNPAGPRPCIKAAAAQLGELWPLDEVIAQWLRNWRPNREAAWQDMAAGLLHTMLWKGCKGWRRDAELMDESFEALLPGEAPGMRFLAAEEGGVVFWLWTLRENMSGGCIASCLCESLPTYHPFVLRDDLSGKAALEACERAQAISERRNLRYCVSALRSNISG